MNAFDFEHLMAYVVAAMLIAVFVLIFYNRLFVWREQEVNAQDRSQNARLGLVLQTGNLRIWIYQVATRHYVRFSETGEYTDEYNPVEFSQFFNREGFEQMRGAVFDICEGKRETAKFNIESSAVEGGQPSTYEIHISVASRNKRGEPERLLGIERDITDSINRERGVTQLLMRYHTVFNSALSDMLYYDKNGVLRDINEKARSTFHVTNLAKIEQGAYSLNDNPFFSHLDINHLYFIRSTAFVDFDHLEDRYSHLKALNLHGKMYYESTINPVRNADGDLDGIYISKVDHAAMVEIDEEGVTGAAYTDIMYAGAGMPPEEEVDFVLDRPFMYVITAPDGSLLFAGTVYDLD